MFKLCSRATIPDKIPESVFLFDHFAESITNYGFTCVLPKSINLCKSNLNKKRALDDDKEISDPNKRGNPHATKRKLDSETFNKRRPESTCIPNND